MAVAWVGAGIAAVGLVSSYSTGKKAAGAAQTQADAAAAATNQQAAIAQDQWATYKEIYQPLERQYATEAQNYDTPEQYQKAAGDASATVSEQFGKARDRLSRTPGLDPSSGAATAAMAGLDMNQAATDAVSQNAARTNVKNTAWARKTDALSLGKGLPAQASATLGSVAIRGLVQANYNQGLANQQGAQAGNLISQGINAWNKSPGLSYTPDSSYGTATGGRADDFSTNMQQFGI